MKFTGQRVWIHLWYCANSSAIFPPSTKVLPVRDPPMPSLFGRAHTHSFEGNYNQSWISRKLLSLKQSLQHSCISYLAVTFLPPSSTPGSALVLTMHIVEGSKLVIAIGRLLTSLTCCPHHNSLSLTLIYFQGKVGYIEIKRPCVDLGYFQDAILQYKMLPWAFQGGL